MKKLLAFSAMALLAVSAFGQGQVTFNNVDKTGTPIIDAKIYDMTVGGTALSGTAARVALLGGPTTGTAANPSALVAGNLKVLAAPDGTSWVNFRTGTAAGYVATSGNTARILTDVGYGTQCMLQMVAWTGNFTDWQSAFAAAQTDVNIKVGASAAWNVTTTLNATDLGFARNIGLTSFAIAPIPEPTTMALAGLGAAALLIFRRRK